MHERSGPTGPRGTTTVWERRDEMRKLIKSKKATVVVQVLTGAGSLTALVAVLGAGLKWS
jgi:hypothetical protein